MVGWEPRYDRCKCDGFWPRARHAVIRNFVTYDGTEKHLRPQLMPYIGHVAAREAELSSKGISKRDHSGLGRQPDQRARRVRAGDRPKDQEAEEMTHATGYRATESALWIYLLPNVQLSPELVP